MKSEAQLIPFKSIKAEIYSSNKNEGAKFDNALLPVFTAAGLVYFSLIIIPILEIVHISGTSSLIKAFQISENWSAIRLSLVSSLTTVLLVFLIGTPAAYMMSGKEKGFLPKLFEVLMILPTVLPPAVAGLGLLLAFGRNGSIGQLLSRFDINFVFTPVAVIMAQFFVSSGFYVQVLKAGMSTIDKDVIEAAYIQGASKLDTFVLIILPILKKSMAAGLIISWTRALGEFGATITFAGNVLDKTRTMPLQVYTLMQTDLTMAASLSFILLLLSFMMLFLVKFRLGE